MAAVSAASHQAELVLVGATGESAGQRWTVSAATAVVGRAATADVHIDHRSISRSHCRITRENDEFFIEDAGGQNGTFVNGERVRSKVRIANGSRIGVASVELVASVIAPAKAAAAAPAGHTVVVDVSEALAAADAMPAVETTADAEPEPVEIPSEAEASAEAEPSMDEAEIGEEAASDEEMPDEAAEGEVLADERILSEGNEVVAPISLDELGAAADEFWRRFDVARGALQAFQSRYIELGGRDAAIDLAAQAMVTQERPDDPATLISLRQHAKRIEQLALAAIELADAMGYETTESSETTEDVELAEDGDTTEGSSSAENKGE